MYPFTYWLASLCVYCCLFLLFVIYFAKPFSQTPADFTDRIFWWTIHQSEPLLLLQKRNHVFVFYSFTYWLMLSNAGMWAYLISHLDPLFMNFVSCDFSLFPYLLNSFSYLKTVYSSIYLGNLSPTHCSTNVGRYFVLLLGFSSNWDYSIPFWPKVGNEKL